MSDVIKKFPKFRLIIIGSRSRSYKDCLENLTKTLRLDKHIVFTGAVQDVKIFYEIADIFILPSRSEGISNALLETIPMEITVIATNVGGTPEIIKNLDNGCLISPSSDDIAEKLELLITNIGLRNRLGKAARKTVISNFSMERAVEKYMKLYTRICT
ncbi:MAG: glycosyltransferase family 4 protein [Candidatus Baldrarchaeia archaeon]